MMRLLIQTFVVLFIISCASEESENYGQLCIQDTENSSINFAVLTDDKLKNPITVEPPICVDLKLSGLRSIFFLRLNIDNGETFAWFEIDNEIIAEETMTGPYAMMTIEIQ